jgi:hypothetical protein
MADCPRFNYFKDFDRICHGKSTLDVRGTHIPVDNQVSHQENVWGGGVLSLE